MSELNLEEIRGIFKLCNDNGPYCTKCKLDGQRCGDIRQNMALSMADEIELLRKESVWSKAPFNADRAEVDYSRSKLIPEEPVVIKKTLFTRSLPKTREREIAEKYAKGNWTTADIIEQAILEAKGE